MTMQETKMNLFKERGWGCEHNRRNKTGNRACQKCLFHDWYWCSKIGNATTIILVIVTYPFWWLRYGRNMDKRGFMKGEKGYKEYE